MTSKVDVWAFGIIIYEIFFNRHPFGFDEKPQIEVVTNIAYIEYTIPDSPKVSESIKKAIRMCLQYRDQRASISEILSLDCFKENYIRKAQSEVVNFTF